MHYSDTPTQNTETSNVQFILRNSAPNANTWNDLTINIISRVDEVYDECILVFLLLSMRWRIFRNHYILCYTGIFEMNFFVVNPQEIQFFTRLLKSMKKNYNVLHVSNNHHRLCLWFYFDILLIYKNLSCLTIITDRLYRKPN